MQAGWTLDSVNLPLPRESTKVSVEGPAGVGLQPGQMSGKVFCCLHGGARDEESAGVACDAGKRRTALFAMRGRNPLGKALYIDTKGPDQCASSVASPSQSNQPMRRSNSARLCRRSRIPTARWCSAWTTSMCRRSSARSRPTSWPRNISARPACRHA
ncbi:hypothetical protein MPL3356_160003 [Mesorhizobium plurifarium]|uniref:Uncharacterized protein n=1 Tax=Mesorhizobium plurifarium TaxID=69974 RepID=A0A090DFG8_MESPL|nr:hypothetical protein MPL3356_160003 [Mesorhizobium plurifarium]